MIFHVPVHERFLYVWCVSNVDEREEGIKTISSTVLHCTCLSIWTGLQQPAACRGKKSWPFVTALIGRFRLYALHAVRSKKSRLLFQNLFLSACMPPIPLPLHFFCSLYQTSVFFDRLLLGSVMLIVIGACVFGWQTVCRGRALCLYMQHWLTKHQH